MRRRHSRKETIIRFAHTLTACTCAALTVLAFSAQAQWQPTRNVEIIAPAAAGSALDSVARLVQKVLQDKKLVTANLTVVDKAGGGNAVGFNYLNSRPADGQAVLVTPFTIITNRITGANPINYQDITPISMLADEHIAFVVNANSSIKNGRDLLERLKRDPASVSMALAAALGNANHIAVSLAAKTVGADPKRFRIAVFNSSGESITAVLGGHVELAITTTGLVGGHVQAGRVRVIAVASEKRLAGALAAVPTWREQGADVVFSSWRALIGPRGMTPEQVAYWDGLMAKLSTQDEWLRDLDQNALTPAYMNAEATRKVFAQQADTLRAILTDLGLAR
ncbi:MAG: tctC6 [Betaproteobacteria bacterium]|nr:tctC6 [Betaproteobacteria bacterium]